jgi:hypothetical protein
MAATETDTAFNDDSFFWGAFGIAIVAFFLAWLA